jgi:hypothetical protein
VHPRPFLQDHAPVLRNYVAMLLWPVGDRTGGGIAPRPPCPRLFPLVWCRGGGWPLRAQQPHAHTHTQDRAPTRTHKKSQREGIDRGRWAIAAWRRRANTGDVG